MSDEPVNYLSIENGVSVINCSSQMPNCYGKNVLTTDRKAIWLSGQGIPQSFTLDLSNQIKRPKFFNCFGLDCWHDYASNPSMIELLVSTDGDEFITWTMIHPELRAGVQLFQIDPLGTRYNFIKVVIRETYGAAKTYLNQIFLFEDNPLKKMNSASRINESMSLLNQSNVINPRKDEEAHYNDNFMENFSHGQHLGSNIKQKMTQQSTDDLDLLHMYNQNKPVNFNEHQTSVKKRPPPGVFHTNSTQKAEAQNRNDQEYPIAQRQIPMPMSTPGPNLPLYPQPEAYDQKMGSNMTHESAFYQNQEVAGKPMSRRNSYSGFANNEYNQTMGFEQQVQKPPIGNTAGKIYSSSPARAMQNPNYGRPPYVGSAQNSAYLPQDQLNDSFGSVNEKITSMNEEVKKLAHSKSVRSSEENFRGSAKNVAAVDDEDMNLPLLTQSEKEVKQMKKEMQKWGGMMASLQDNMSKLLGKVSDMQNNMDNVKTKVAHIQSGEKMIDTIRTERETRTSHSTEKSLADQLGTPDNFETLRSQITNYLENVMSQNQVIIQENQKLRQSVDQHRTQPPSSSKRVFDKDEMETQHNQPAWNQADLEKTVTVVFEKNMKVWENSLFKRIKAQNSSLEERITEKLAGEFESMRDEEQSFRRKIEEDLKQLKLKVGYLEQNSLKTSELSSYRLSEEHPISTKERTRPLPMAPNKENIPNYQNQTHTRRAPKNVSSVDARKPKAQLEDSAKDLPLANSSTSSLSKIQDLMEKLNNKIALRDKKVQLLQHQTSRPSSQADKEAAISSGEESLEESLFNNKKTSNTISARKKALK